MGWGIRLYVGFLFVSGLFSAMLAVSTLRLRDRPGGLPLSFLLLAIAEWSLALGGEYLADTISAKLLWARIEYVGTTSSPVLLFLFALELTRQRKGVDRRHLVPLWVIPAITLGLVLTNEHHHLIWTSFTPSPVPDSNLIIYGHGVWFWIGIAYTYLLLCAATVLLIRAALRLRHVYRQQHVMLLIGMVPPWAASVVYLVAPDPIKGLDVTPVGFALTGLLLAWGFRRLHLIDLLPVARDVLIEDMEEGVVVLDGHNRIVDVNPAAQTLVGLEPDSVIGQDAATVLGRRLGGEGGSPPSLDRDGEAFLEGVGHLEWTVSSLGHRVGIHSGRLIIVRDVTDRTVAQNELRRLNARLEAEVQARTAEIRAEKERSEAILRSVDDGILMTECDSSVRYVNEAFSRLTGFSSDELVGTPIRDFMEHFCVGGTDKLPTLILGAAETWQGEVRARRKDGLVYDAEVTLAPVRDRAGRFEGHVCTIRDVSQREKLVRARDRFLENVSHQFRTPVATLKLYVHLAQQEKLPPMVAEYLSVMRDQIDWLDVLIDDVVQMTSLDSGKGALISKPVSLDRILTSVRNRFWDRFESSSLEFGVAPLPVNLPTVLGDEVRLVQALNEIVENALRFTPPGGRVMLKAEVAERGGTSGLAISVKDTGPGIPLDEQDRVFERFFRGRVAASGNTPGTGLGLSMAQAIVQAHGGQIELQSDDQGSTFLVWLPAG